MKGDGVRHNCCKANDSYQKISGRSLFILGNFIMEVNRLLYIYVGLAGIIGALFRYFIGIYFNQWWFYDFPLATFLTNMAGSFILGWLTTFLPRFKFIHPYMATALGTGFVGSFTTFSTFSVETVHLISVDKWGTAILYVLLSLMGGLLSSWLGYHLGTAAEKREEILSKVRGGN
jgi:CrcB protein